MPEEYSLMPRIIRSIIDYGSALWDSASANTLKPLVSWHKRALKPNLLKTTALAISDENSLSIPSLKERLNYNDDVLMLKIMSGKDPLSFTAKLSLKPIETFWKAQYTPIPRIDLFKSGVVYSDSVLWNSLLDFLRLPSSTELIGWLVVTAR